MKLDGQDIKTLIPGFKVLNIDRGYMPPQEPKIKEVPFRPELYFVKRKDAKRQIKVEFQIKAATDQEMRIKLEQLAETLSSEEPATIIFDDEPEREWLVTPEGAADLDEKHQLSRGTIRFLCLDPYKRATTIDIKAAPGPITNDGHVKSFPEIIVNFTGPATEYKITQVETGDFVRVVRNFALNDKLVIDAAAEKIELNGVKIMGYLDHASDFFSIPSGTTNYQVSAANCTTSIRFAKRWR